MFRNLTTGQWVMFFALTFFTIFGGFLYVAAEAHFNRADGRVVPVAIPVAPTPRTPMPEWFKTCVYAVAAFLLAMIVVQHLVH